MYFFYLRLLQQAFIDMENMFEMLAEKQDVSGTNDLRRCTFGCRLTFVVLSLSKLIY